MCRLFERGLGHLSLFCRFPEVLEILQVFGPPTGFLVLDQGGEADVVNGDALLPDEESLRGPALPGFGKIDSGNGVDQIDPVRRIAELDNRSLGRELGGRPYSRNRTSPKFLERGKQSPAIFRRGFEKDVDVAGEPGEAVIDHSFRPDDETSHLMFEKERKEILDILWKVGPGHLAS